MCSGGVQVLLGLYSVAVETVAVFKKGDYYLYAGGCVFRLAYKIVFNP